MTTTWAPSGDVAGLTDHPRLPRLGKIHLGVKKLSGRGNEYPSATDYFVVPKVIQDVYGEKPRELDVVFPTDDIGRVAGVSWKNYSAARGKVCWGDGTKAVRMIDLEKLPRRDRYPEYSQDEYDAAIVTKDSTKIERREIACPAKDCVFAKKNACKPVMNLMVLLPKVPGIGIWQLDTGSINSILDVRGGIDLVTRLSGGVLAGIPLKLRLEPMEVISPEDQKKKVVFTLKLISPATLGRVLMAGERNLRELLMADNPETPQVALPEPRDVPPLAEPEEDLYPRSVIDASPSDSFQDRSGHSSPREEMSAPSASRPQAEGRPGAPLASPDDDMAIAAEIEELFAELKTPAKEREMYRGAYKGRAKQLLSMLRSTAEKKRK